MDYECKKCAAKALLKSGKFAVLAAGSLAKALRDDCSDVQEVAAKALSGLGMAAAPAVGVIVDSLTHQ